MLLFLFLSTVLSGGGVPPKWWLNTNGVSITSNDQFKNLIGRDDSEFANKHVFIDFYMQGCYWCWVFQKDWNQIVAEMKESYGD